MLQLLLNRIFFWEGVDWCDKFSYEMNFGNFVELISSAEEFLSIFFWQVGKEFDNLVNSNLTNNFGSHKILTRITKMNHNITPDSIYIHQNSIKDNKKRPNHPNKVPNQETLFSTKPCDMHRVRKVINFNSFLSPSMIRIIFLNFPFSSFSISSTSVSIRNWSQIVSNLLFRWALDKS